MLAFAQLDNKLLIFATQHPRKVFRKLAVIRFEKTAFRLTAILLPRCATCLLSGANIQTYFEIHVKSRKDLSNFKK